MYQSTHSLWSKHRQAGASTLGTVFLVVMLALCILVVIRVFPTVTEYYAISKTVKSLTDVPSLERVRLAFDQAARVNDIVSVSGRDLDVIRDDSGKMDIRFAYRREVSLLGPVSLVIAYSGGSK